MSAPLELENGRNMNTGTLIRDASDDQPRTRLVVFRVTATEYHQIRKACSLSYRSLSDFTRAALLKSITAENESSSCSMPAVSAQLDHLRASVEDLRELVLRMSSSDTTAGEAGVAKRKKTEAK
jgi:hypothetical protein